MFVPARRSICNRAESPRQYFRRRTHTVFLPPLHTSRTSVASQPTVIAGTATTRAMMATATATMITEATTAADTESSSLSGIQ
jgi:hypothetical protein